MKKLTPTLVNLMLVSVIALAVAVTAVLIGLFLYDYSRPDRGWIRHENTEYITDTK